MGGGAPAGGAVGSRAAACGRRDGRADAPSFWRMFRGRGTTAHREPPSSKRQAGISAFHAPHFLGAAR